MLQGKYPGESPEKSLVRAQVYNTLSRYELYHRKHIVLAGEGGDIRYLQSLGVSTKQIIACDRDSSARRMAKQLGVILPSETIACDIVRTVAWAYAQPEIVGNLGSVNVDLCCSLIFGVPILRRVITLLDDLAPASDPISVFFTFACYRDKGFRLEKKEASPGKKRLQFLEENLGRKAELVLPYQSWRKDSHGSPMCMVKFSAHNGYPVLK